MALAFLEEEALHAWPVVCMAELPELRREIEGCRFLRLIADSTGEDPLIVFAIQEQTICLQSDLGTCFAWRPFTGNQPTPDEIDLALRAAEIFAQVRHPLSLPISGVKSLRISDAEFEIQVDLVEDGQRVRAVEAIGTDTLDEEQCISIVLRNDHPAQEAAPPLATERRRDADDEGFPLLWPDDSPVVSRWWKS
ncbi:hypothetical protein BJY04DRAFT_222726 [Aspergillus karnatakaensis]|uniref:uncharacterized protein n=1 Tax=Aspergillus karnatakaensis TaxID=1810916 RepID=UPI003CCD4AD9